MRFAQAAIPGDLIWSSPFVRWQGALGEVSSLDLAALVTKRALAERQAPVDALSQVILGITIPQRASFYGTPWLSARIGAEGISGPMIAQACATSVACLHAAAVSAELRPDELALVVTTDRTSNGPLLVYPAQGSAGGDPATEHWVTDNFRKDPWAGESMVRTAEHVALEGAMKKAELDELALLRYEQYRRSFADERAFQRQYMVPVELPGPKGQVQEVVEDGGIHAYSREGLERLKPVLEGGVVSYGTQTHPADGCAGAIVCGAERARRLGAGRSVTRLLASAFARVEKARMPKAATVAAQLALQDAGVGLADVRYVTTHNPFAVNDLWFSRETAFPLERMNPYGCSLIYGHPQAPTGMRAIAELIHALRRDGGGVGLFTGCAAGDTGAALVLSVEA